MTDTNYLIIGSGVAGLTFAIRIADRFPEKKVRQVSLEVYLTSMPCCNLLAKSLFLILHFGF